MNLGTGRFNVLYSLVLHVLHTCCFLCHKSPDVCLMHSMCRFQNPIENGQHTNSTSEDVKIMNQRSHILYEQLKGFVQRVDMNVVKKDLPPKTVFVVTVKLSPLQRKLYKRFLDVHGFTNLSEKAMRRSCFFAGYQALAQVLLFVLRCLFEIWLALFDVLSVAYGRYGIILGSCNWRRNIRRVKDMKMLLKIFLLIVVVMTTRSVMWWMEVWTHFPVIMIFLLFLHGYPGSQICSCLISPHWHISAFDWLWMRGIYHVQIWLCLIMAVYFISFTIIGKCWY